MAVSPEDVIAAYRFILGRDPEGEEVVAQFLSARDRGHLRELFLGCAEFAGQFIPPSPFAPVGRFFDAEDVDIEVNCSAVDRQAMFDRIGDAWRSFGRTEPHWSVIVNDDFLQGNLAANIDRFYMGGRGDIGLSMSFLRRAGLSARFERAMDFGCGVGRLTLAIADYADEVVGVDISPPHLALAKERAEAEGISNVSFDSIESVEDLGRYRAFDLIMSFIVLQHNPPPVMAALFRRLLGALAPGGVAMIQMPTYLPGQRFSVADYLANQQPSMEMNALPQKVIFDIVDDCGCKLLEVREDNAIGNMGVSHVFVIQRSAAVPH